MVQKDTDQRSETVQDAVRRTEVEDEDDWTLGTTSGSNGAGVTPRP